MDTIQKALEGFKPSMTEKVIRYRLEKVRHILDDSNFETLVYLATRFSFEDTFNLGTTYPTIYGEVFALWVETSFDTYWTFNTDKQKREEYNNGLAKTISDDFFEFRDGLGLFALDNIEIIEKRGNE